MTPNLSVKPTRSGLRPPRAAYLIRWAAHARTFAACNRLKCCTSLPLPSLSRFACERLGCPLSLARLRMVFARVVFARSGFPSVALRGPQKVLPGPDNRRYRCSMPTQRATRHEPALEAPAGINVSQFVGAAAKGGSEVVPRRGLRAPATVVRSPAVAPYSVLAGPEPVRPNLSVKPTRSGLRPPRAAYLIRWAAHNAGDSLALFGAAAP
jgi:hypothetical protein